MMILDMVGMPFDLEAIEAYQEQVNEAHQTLHQGTCPGGEFSGWVDYPTSYNHEELAAILDLAQDWRRKLEALIVIGIGGSYLGTRMVYEALMPYYHEHMNPEDRGGPALYFAGNDLSPGKLQGLMQLLENQSVGLCVVSKSGRTLEPAIAFRVLRRWMEERYGDEAINRIVAVTDGHKGALKTLADAKGYRTFVVPEGIGGRYSVLTPVGTVPLAVAGIDVKELLRGSEAAQRAYALPELSDNPCYRYAVARNLLYHKGKTTEIMVQYEPKYRFITEWWKQLFGESEGKDGKGIFPAGLLNTTDLHSMGQWVQDGPRTIFETVIAVEKNAEDLVVPAQADALDGLDDVGGQSLHQINGYALEGTARAHIDGNVPQCILRLPKMDAFSLGHLLYFFMKACAISGLLLGVNPFDQPGVEAYKTNLTQLLKA